MATNKRFLDQNVINPSGTSNNGGPITILSASVDLGKANVLNFTGSTVTDITVTNGVALIDLNYALDTSSFVTFPYIGSALITGSLGLTGSLAVRLDTGNGNPNKFQVNNEGVMILGTFATPPTASAGGMFYSASGEYFLGFP